MKLTRGGDVSSVFRYNEWWLGYSDTAVTLLTQLYTSSTNIETYIGSGLADLTTSCNIEVLASTVHG